MNKRLLFVGVSSMRNHAGQDKLYFLADQLAQRGIPITVLVPDFEENRAFLRQRSHIQARYYEPGSALGDLRQKTRMVQEGSWSAIWIVGVGLRSFVMRGRATRGVPIIKDFDEFPSMADDIGPFRRAYLKWMERRMVLQAQGFTCASAYLEASVRAQRPDIGERLLRLPVAISSQEHRIDPELVARLRKDAHGRPILLYVGSMRRMYDEQITELIELALVLRRRGSDAIVRIAGTGPDMDYFKAKADDAKVGNSLEFSGHVRRDGDLSAHMEAANVLIFPFPSTKFNISRCPTKAYHYAAANRPVITNRTGEVAALFGRSALYYPERNVEALADRCLHGLKQSPGYSNGIAMASLTWESRADQFIGWLAERGWLPEAAPVPVSEAQ
ncbi:MAG TPA: glycosyltransferase family 4 protein [Opitutaceae bacterium]|nr:glycosyltransferase family 4 protein [Opitutaceae bacterium]